MIPPSQNLPPWRPELPLASVFGHNSFSDAELKIGKGTISVRGDQALTNGQIEQILKPQIQLTYRVMDPKEGRVVANVLRQPRRDDARIIGLVNYTGSLQRNVGIALPEGLQAPAAAVVSPDGYAAPLEVKNGTVTLPALYNYSIVLMGPQDVVNAAVATIAPKADVLARLREPLKAAGGSQVVPEIPADQQLSRLRHGDFHSATAFVADATSPRKVKKGEVFRIEMNVSNIGFSSFGGRGAAEYMRFRLMNVKTGQEVMSKPQGRPRAD